MYKLTFVITDPNGLILSNNQSITFPDLEGCILARTAAKNAIALFTDEDKSYLKEMGIQLDTAIA